MTYSSITFTSHVIWIMAENLKTLWKSKIKHLMLVYAKIRMCRDEADE